MNQLSTENLNLLPNANELQRICKSISSLEAIISPDWEYRYYSYQKKWSETEACCEMRNGEGDQMLILFSNEGACINGFAHESEMNGWKKVTIQKEKTFVEKLFGSKKEQKTKLIQEISEGLLDELPESFKGFIFGEPIQSIGTTFCIWQSKVGTHWKTGKVDLPNNKYKDGSAHLLKVFDGNPEKYKTWAEEYYEVFEENKLPLELVEYIYNENIITREFVQELNPKLEDFKKLKSDLDDIGYENQL